MDKPVKQQIGSIALLVECYSDALDFYINKLNFELVQDIDSGDGKRWVQISPRNANGTHILLVKAESESQLAVLGKQAGGGVFLILQSNDFWRDYEFMLAQGVVFDERPRTEPYGTVVVFQDLYGNKWDLIQTAE
ncbi:VOC family protein [Aliiglaciecola lipolytica]|uniref:Glyoxalase family protein n=1 Tax=Aliiglaciecola lipolytica E3 TaxID=1127673 RepID=K6X6H6_9ALTE|nr:VOC family protein [Aliiglaciecola lipolytica]GAC16224.1 glyoxalase family protein [Aliiglaciecola lipolytica E3]